MRWYPYNEERPARPIKPIWDRVQDDARLVQAVLATKKKEAIRRGSFNSATLMRHF